jgi:AAA domain
MIFLNFEDDRLLPIKSLELDLILSAHTELYPEFADRRKFFFFDEIQNAPRWESFVRRLHDTQDAQIFLTDHRPFVIATDHQHATVRVCEAANPLQILVPPGFLPFDVLMFVHLLQHRFHRSASE